MVARHALNVKPLVRIQTPQPEVFTSLICFAVKGGGEVKKKQWCLLKRFATLVAALLMICCMTAPAFAASDEAAMPSFDDFKAHPDSFYVWRSAVGFATRYELIAGPMVLTGDSLIAGMSAHHSYSCSFKNFEYSEGDGSYTVFGCAVPSPIRFYYSTLDFLPSFRIDSFSAWYGTTLHFYPVDGQDLSNVYCYIVPLYGSADKALLYSNSDSSSFDSLDAAFFDSPFLSYPFALRSYSKTVSNGFALVGGTPLFDSYTISSFLSLDHSYFLSSTLTLSPYPDGYSIPSSDIGVVFVRKPSGTYITDASSYSVSVDGAFSFLVPKTLLSGVKPGDWISAADVENLQDQLLNDFDVNSDTLKNSKQNFDSWQNSNTIDTDVADTSLDLINGLMQNVGQFVFVVSLLCFGAVVLRVLIRKAVEG